MGASGLGSLLVKEGFLTEQDRLTIIKTCGQGSWAFAKSILAIGLLDEDELAAFFAERTRYPVAPRDIVKRVDPKVAQSIDRRLVTKLEVLPLRREATKLTVGVLDPLDKSTLKQLEFFTGLEVEPVVVPLSQLYEGLHKLDPAFRASATALTHFLDNHVQSAWVKQKMTGSDEVEVVEDDEPEIEELYEEPMELDADEEELEAQDPHSLVDRTAETLDLDAEGFADELFSGQTDDEDEPAPAPQATAASDFDDDLLEAVEEDEGEPEARELSDLDLDEPTPTKSAARDVSSAFAAEDFAAELEELETEDELSAPTPIVSKAASGLDALDSFDPDSDDSLFASESPKPVIENLKADALDEDLAALESAAPEIEDLETESVIDELDDFLPDTEAALQVAVSSPEPLASAEDSEASETLEAADKDLEKLLSIDDESEDAEFGTEETVALELDPETRLETSSGFEDEDEVTAIHEGGADALLEVSESPAGLNRTDESLASLSARGDAPDAPETDFDLSPHSVQSSGDDDGEMEFDLEEQAERPRAPSEHLIPIEDFDGQEGAPASAQADSFAFEETKPRERPAPTSSPAPSLAAMADDLSPAAQREPDPDLLADLHADEPSFSPIGADTHVRVVQPSVFAQDEDTAIRLRPAPRARAEDDDDDIRIHEPLPSPAGDLDRPGREARDSGLGISSQLNELLLKLSLCFSKDQAWALLRSELAALPGSGALLQLGNPSSVAWQGGLLHAVPRTCEAQLSKLNPGQWLPVQLKARDSWTQKDQMLEAYREGQLVWLQTSKLEADEVAREAVENLLRQARLRLGAG